MNSCILPDEAATITLAGELAGHLPARAVVWLHGDLGAGKSTFARAMLRTLAVQGSIRSPTYTLVERYPIAGGDALHLDLYRIGDAGELEFLGLDADEGRLWLVEWPERGASALPPADLHVRLEVVGCGRSAAFEADSDVGREWLEKFVKPERLLTQVPDLQGIR
ncbi:tRNA (adenosine(37)-N6)-threonylcarbamoyltransferase complex ATPase subunit type 1 TsaE [Solilutibacter silvestris]|uniref:tRNA threonylcarbamoyladenosine biosynthesis protein TsaE n=1 Tax=Solilutibacter silvestris TaxID=1645665 RepID=A0A2K1PYW2_9GAMM|nr:tRNA (adenosine(37)-N6)-threonylcarbamoyltransferase complex ATPase subunit type 1 TsaE [Lysobacter silvestris]PNS07985.1 tRNA threonylcarbamoyl adenosine modification protein YjeE [Lysobacter silvestris]